MGDKIIGPLALKGYRVLVQIDDKEIGTIISIGNMAKKLLDDNKVDIGDRLLMSKIYYKTFTYKDNIFAIIDDVTAVELSF